MTRVDGERSPSVLLAVDGQRQIATLTLNRPEALNAISRQLAAELLAACDALAERDDVRAVIVTGAGERAFCAGADLKERRGSRAGGARRAHRAQSKRPRKPWRPCRCRPSRRSVGSPWRAAPSWPSPATSGSPPQDAVIRLSGGEDRHLPRRRRGACDCHASSAAAPPAISSSPGARSQRRRHFGWDWSIGWSRQRVCPGDGHGAGDDDRGRTRPLAVRAVSRLWRESHGSRPAEARRSRQRAARRTRRHRRLRRRPARRSPNGARRDSPAADAPGRRHERPHAAGIDRVADDRRRPSPRCRRSRRRRSPRSAGASRPSRHCRRRAACRGRPREPPADRRIGRAAGAGAGDDHRAGQPSLDGILAPARRSGAARAARRA